MNIFSPLELQPNIEGSEWQKCYMINENYLSTSRHLYDSLKENAKILDEIFVSLFPSVMKILK